MNADWSQPEWKRKPCSCGLYGRHSRVQHINRLAALDDYRTREHTPLTTAKLLNRSAGFSYRKISTPSKLISIARKLRRLYIRARRTLGPDLAGRSMLDLAADHLPDLPLRTLQDALVVAGLREDERKN